MEADFTQWPLIYSAARQRNGADPDAVSGFRRSENLENFTNEQLLARYQKGEFSAFDVFYRKNSQVVLGYLMSKTRNRELAEDVLQDTFLRMHKYILRYDPEKSAINWVLSIAKNTLATAWSKQKTPLPAKGDIEDVGPGLSDLAELRNEIQVLLAGFSEQERELLEERFFNDKSFEEIAGELKLSQVNVRQRVSRIIKKIRSQAVKTR